VRWARHLDEVRQAQRLRYQIFAEEMGAVLQTPVAGHDIDVFDDFCEHLMVCDEEQNKVIGTYPHGPVLARNPDLADHLLELALGHPLEPLPNPELDELRRQRIAAVRKAGLRR
ncbi:MAG: GNAT family N-acetyltransferase, partial [Propionicimonas sp.]